MDKHFDLDNDVLPQRAILRIGGYDLIVDPQLYTVAAEVRVHEAVQRESALLAVGEVLEARDVLLGAAEMVLRPGNPEWTKEIIAERLSVPAIGTILSFFVALASRGPNSPILDTLAQRISAVQQAMPLVSSPTTSPTPTIPPTGRPRTRGRAAAAASVGVA